MDLPCEQVPPPQHLFTFPGPMREYEDHHMFRRLLLGEEPPPNNYSVWITEGWVSGTGRQNIPMSRPPQTH